MVQNRQSLEDKLRLLIPALKSNFHVGRIGIFGSFARNKPSKDSDIDILVQFEKPIGWEIVDLKEFLEVELGRKVDMVTENGLKPQYKEDVMQEVHYV